LAMTKGTLLVVWDVLGLPSSLSISSALLRGRGDMVSIYMYGGGEGGSGARDIRTHGPT
jgi:hypothetical protein